MTTSSTMELCSGAAPSETSAIEYDRTGRALCKAVLWGARCSYFKRLGRCDYSHEVPEELAAKYAALAQTQRSELNKQRAEERAAAREVVPPPPQPAHIELMRTTAILDCGLAEERSGLVQLTRAVLECRPGEALSCLHLRGPEISQFAPPLCPTLMYAFRLGGFALPPDWVKAMMRGKRHISKLHSSHEYQSWLEGYDQFVREVVLPSLGDPVGVYYQRPPTLRVAMPSRKATIGKHRDADYPGHHPAEINFWVPLTDVEGSSALWMETAPGEGDFHAVPLRVGQALRFNGSLCRHHTVPNVTGCTRVSFDLRAVPASATTVPVTRIGDYGAAFIQANVDLKEKH